MEKKLIKTTYLHLKLSHTLRVVEATEVKGKMLLVQARTDLKEGYRGRDRKRGGESWVRMPRGRTAGNSGWGGGQERDEGERLFVVLLLCHHQWCHWGRSVVGRQWGEEELTSSTSWSSVSVYYHILHIKALNSHTACVIRGLLKHFIHQIVEKKKCWVHLKKTVYEHNWTERNARM